MNSAGGVIVTCRHALELDGPFVLAAVTAEGRVIGVKEILLADKDADIAFLRIDATDLPALPITRRTSMRVNRVRVLSYIRHRYYFLLSDGIVARHSRADPDEKDADAPRSPQLDITADIAEGSSGGPVLDLSGNVVGVAQSYAIAENDDKETAFKHRGAIPATAILAAHEGGGRTGEMMAGRPDPRPPWPHSFESPRTPIPRGRASCGE